MKPGVFNMSKTKSRTYFLAVFLIVYLALTYLARIYNDVPNGSWQSEIYNDKAGYYVYLPATFIYGYHYSDELEKVREKLSGFKYSDGKLFIKYPMGVALLVLPFFLITHLIALAGAGPADGFSGIYYEMTYFASVFYFLLGALILFRFLRRKFSLQISMMTLATIMFGTNAYYYALREPLFSHIYSFFLFSLLLLLTDNLWSKPGTKKLCLTAIVSGLIFLVRPSNIIFLPVLLFLGLSSFKDLVNRLKFIIKPVNLLSFILLFIIILLPQIIYWKFLSGNFLFYSYQDEEFKYWKNPMVLEVLFSPVNGLLLYSPAYLLVLFGLILMIIRKEADRWLIPAVTLLLLHMVSSWHSFHFGCSFGQRSFVEYLALFSIPLAFLLKWLFKTLNPVILILTSILIAYLIYVNISISSIYPKCHLGGLWEWQPYRYYYYQAKIFPVYQQRMVKTWFDDFENTKQYNFSTNQRVKFSRAYSGEFVSGIADSAIYSDNFSLDLKTLKPGILLDVEVKLRCYFNGPPGKALIVCSLENEKGIFFYKTLPIHEVSGIMQNNWNKINRTFKMENNPTKGKIKVYVWKQEGNDLYLDDFRIKISSY